MPRYGTLVATDRLHADGRLSGPGPGAGIGDGVFSIRQRYTIAEINAGQTILAGVNGRKYRLLDAYLIAIGGNLGSTSATHVEVRGPQSGSAVALFKVAKAELTQSALNRFGTTNTLILADGASQAPCDDGGAITVNPLGGSDFDTATHIDVILYYTSEDA